MNSKVEFNRFDRCFVSENSAIVDMALMSYSVGVYYLQARLLCLVR